MPPNNTDDFVLTAEPHHAGIRLDQFISDGKSCSRNLAAVLVKKGVIRVNGRLVKPSLKIKAGDTVSGCIPTESPRVPEPEAMPLVVLYSDQHLVVINKPPGMVVHPAPGHDHGTVVNALLYHYPEIRAVGENDRPGIVHRLDRDTSGALVAARSSEAFNKLSAMFASREISKRYLTLIYGTPKEDNGTIRLPIGRHRAHRKKMSINSEKSRPAETRWRVLKSFGDASLLDVTIKTGRTHQIRVHCAAAKTPVVGDDTYGSRWTRKPVHFQDKTIFRLLNKAPRQMLHAWKLGFIHPVTGKMIRVTAPMAADMKALLRDIKKSKDQASGL